jgi:hypothetical protein
LPIALRAVITVPDVSALCSGVEIHRQSIHFTIDCTTAVTFALAHTPATVTTVYLPQLAKSQRKSQRKSKIMIKRKSQRKSQPR